MQPTNPPPGLEPSQFRAGDSVTWRRANLAGQYPSSAGWVLTYYFRGLPGSFDIVAGADPGSDGFLVFVQAATTAAYAAGDYHWTARVSNAGTGEVYSVNEGSCAVLPNASAEPAAFDVRSNAKKIVDALEAAIAGKAGNDVQMWRIQTSNGTLREISKLKPAELRVEWQYWKRVYEGEQRAEDLARGRGRKSFVQVRF